MQPPQPTYLRKLYAIQPTRSIPSSSCLTPSRPVDPRSLLISWPPTESCISITAPRLWNDLPPELLTISLGLPSPPSLPVTKHHLHLATLSITPGPSTQN